MNLLLDANISWRLVKKIESNFKNCQHVNFIGLQLPVPDLEIWQYALINNFVILTLDSDFENILEINGYPPKVIIIKNGNMATKDIENILINKLNIILEFANNNLLGILEIY